MNKTLLSMVMQSKGITIKNLVEAGIPYGTILGHYYGARQMSLTSARKYAAVLGLSLTEFLAEEVPASPATEREKAEQDA